jgi:hypothetical protein
MKKLSTSAWTRKLDKIVGEIVRSRGECVRCGNTETLQTAHIYCRDNFAVRWDFDNVLCFCYNCHMNFAHKNPIGFTEWVKEYLGEMKYEALKQRSNLRKVWAVYEKEALYELYKKHQADQWQTT